MSGQYSAPCRAEEMEDDLSRNNKNLSIMTVGQIKRDSLSEFSKLKGKQIYVYLHGQRVAVKVTKKDLLLGIKNCIDTYNPTLIHYIENGSGFFITEITGGGDK